MKKQSITKADFDKRLKQKASFGSYRGSQGGNSIQEKNFKQ
jgi:hypothetical protein